MRDVPGPGGLVDRVIDDLAGILRLRTYGLPQAWEDTELTVGQMRLMFKLRRYGPAPMHLVAGWLGVRASSATSAIDRLEAHGLVERIHPEQDRRIVEATLSDAGMQLIDELLSVRREGLRTVLGTLGEDDLQDLDRILRRLVDATGDVTEAL